MDLLDVSASFALETIKSTTRYPALALRGAGVD